MMPVEPLVSVIIATHNRPSLLAEAVASERSQTRSDWEIIVVDNGSTPPVEATVAEEDARIHLMRFDQNQSPAKALNAGCAVSKGRFVVPMGDDDVWLPTFLEETVAILNTDQRIGMVGTALTEVDLRSGSVRHPHREGPVGYNTITDIVEHGWTIPSAVLIRRNAWESVSGLDESLPYGFDSDLYFRIAERYPCYFLDKELAHYRLHASNLTWHELAVGLDAIHLWEKLLQRRPAGVSLLDVKRKIARKQYQMARLQMGRQRWGEAVRYVGGALRYDPLVGRQFVEPDDSLLVRTEKLLKPYVAIIGLAGICAAALACPPAAKQGA